MILGNSLMLSVKGNIIGNVISPTIKSFYAPKFKIWTALRNDINVICVRLQNDMNNVFTTENTYQNVNLNEIR